MGDNNLSSAGVGFIVLPEGSVRQEYITQCYRTCKVVINGGYGHGLYRDVYIPQSVLQEIEFPLKSESWGTPVVWVKDGYSSLPVIVACLKELRGHSGLSENRWRIVKQNTENLIDVCLDAETNDIQISLNSSGEKTPVFNLKLASKNKDSKINLTSDNEINLTASNKLSINTSNLFSVNIQKNNKVLGSLNWNQEQISLKLFKEEEIYNDFLFTSEQVSMKVNKSLNFFVNDGKDSKINLSYTVEEGFKYSDHFDNQILAKDGEVTIKSKSIKLGDGKEKMVLGESLVDLLKQLCTAISTITVPTPVGPSGVPVNAAQFTVIKSQLETTLSNLSKTD